MKGETGSPVMEMKKATASFREEKLRVARKEFSATIVGAEKLYGEG